MMQDLDLSGQWRGSALLDLAETLYVIGLTLEERWFERRTVVDLRGNEITI